MGTCPSNGLPARAGGPLPKPLRHGFRSTPPRLPQPRTPRQLPLHPRNAALPLALLMLQRQRRWLRQPAAPRYGGRQHLLPRLPPALLPAAGAAGRQADFGQLSSGFARVHQLLQQCWQTTLVYVACGSHMSLHRVPSMMVCTPHRFVGFPSKKQRRTSTKVHAIALCFSLVLRPAANLHLVRTNARCGAFILMDWAFTHPGSSSGRSSGLLFRSSFLLGLLFGPAGPICRSVGDCPLTKAQVLSLEFLQRRRPASRVVIPQSAAHAHHRLEHRHPSHLQFWKIQASQSWSRQRAEREL